MTTDRLFNILKHTSEYINIVHYFQQIKIQTSQNEKIQILRNKTLDAHDLDFPSPKPLFRLHKSLRPQSILLDSTLEIPHRNFPARQHRTFNPKPVRPFPFRLNP